MKKKIILSIVSILFVLNGVTLYADPDVNADDAVEKENIKEEFFCRACFKIHQNLRRLCAANGR